MDDKKFAGVILAVFLAVAAVLFVWGEFFPIMGNEMAYGLISFYFVMPLMSLFCSFFLGMRTGIVKWLLPVPFLFGITNMALSFLVFHNSGGVLYFSLCFFPAVFGFAAGMARAAKKKMD